MVVIMAAVGYVVVAQVAVQFVVIPAIVAPLLICQLYVAFCASALPAPSASTATNPTPTQRATRLITPASDDLAGRTRDCDDTPTCCSFALPLRSLKVIALSRFSSNLYVINQYLLPLRAGERLAPP
jgi:hypothetical protein